MKPLSGWKKFSGYFLPVTKHDLREMEKRMAIKVSELESEIGKMHSKVEKIWGEQQTRYDALLADFTALKEQLENAELPAAAETALKNFDAKLTAFDDTIPDMDE